ncbi:putative hypoxanthine oxidase XdhD [Lachnospiraceae bacterium TWA4]|nr:putative hypoxanthine oxidase XdhD [Lachnospiraceae bacterium TWA4]
MREVGKGIQKKDAMALVTGKPVYMDDLAPKDCLIVKLLRSPHANAIVEEVNKDKALKVPGIEAIYTWEDVPKKRFAQAGQTYPEWSPYDRLILDRHVRFVGDPVAIVAGEDEACVDKALRFLKVNYQVLPAVLDYHKALDNENLVHPEDDWEARFPVGGDPKRNLCAHMEEGNTPEEMDEIFNDCDVYLEETYHVPAVNQAMMETFRTTCYIDTYGRLNVFSSTQIVFHVRRIISHALGIPKSKIRAMKPRIGGGFGAKQTVVSEVYPAFVTWVTKKPSKMIYSRYESQIAGSPRHEMEVKIRLGAMNDGKIRALEVYNLSNTGAYGDHGPTTAGLTGHKTMPLYTGNMERFRHSFDVVYTNQLAAGAYRGYGATQGVFGVESIVNELAVKLNMDPVELRLKNVVKQGMTMMAYSDEVANSCRLDECLIRASEMIGWKDKYPCTDLGNGKVRSVGIAMAMQGSCISYVDVGSATVTLNEDGSYRLAIAAADMGTGCDTILAQMAAECLGVTTDEIFVSGADTDTSPYDSGSYASSTTYVTGQAVVKACTELEKRIKEVATRMLECSLDELDFDGRMAKNLVTGQTVTLEEIGYKSQAFNDLALQVTESHTSPVSPPPYMAGAVEIELDKETGEVEILDYVAVVDCGTVINSNLAKVQTEGGIGQGIGMALYENIQYTEDGRLMNNSLMQYKIPTRKDLKSIRVEFKPSFEPTGPFGAKSIGEIVINTPAPALAHAIYNATGNWYRSLPITSEKIAMGKE